MITRAAIYSLGLTQLIYWGITYYLVGVFDAAMGNDLGWSRAVIHGGFSASLVMTGLVSPVVGRWIDRYGGRPVMIVGALLVALGCAILAKVENVWAYYAAWIELGFAMRLVLYDAAFAALARIAGPAAKRPMAQITLLGGLASTVFWPLGTWLADLFGWRGAVLAYAVIALAAIPLFLTLPNTRWHAGETADPSEPAPASAPAPAPWLPAVLYALLTGTASVLNAGFSAHMIGIMVGLGLGHGAAVGVGALRGFGQTLARGTDVLWGGRLHPLDLNLYAAATLPVAFILGFWSGSSLVAAIGFAFLYGVGNGLMTITRGTMPLVLFDPATYGTTVGRLLVPGFLAAAAAPFIFAVAIDTIGAEGALALALVLTVIMVWASWKLRQGHATQ